MAESGVGPGTTGTTPVTFSGTAADNADGVAPVATGIIRMAAELFGFNGANWDRVFAIGDNADGISASVRGLLPVIARMWGFNGASNDRVRTLSAVGDGLGTLAVAEPGATYAFTTATNATATVTFAAVAGQQHRLLSLAGSYQTTPTSATSVLASDGANTMIQATGAVASFVPPLPSGGLKGAVNTAMSAQIGAGGVAIVGQIHASKITA